MARRTEAIALTLAASQRTKSRNVLVVDDSAVARLIVQRVINETDQFTIVGHAGNAEEALEKLRTLSVDIVILDIEMPGMDGIQALPHIIRRSRNAPILVVSSLCKENAEASVRAMAMGASDFILKPDNRTASAGFSVALVEKMSRLTEAEIPSERTVPAQASIFEGVGTAEAVQRPVNCLAIGASTGGIHALSTFFSELPADLSMPILVTQHLPADFIVYFARQLQTISGRRVVPARDGQRVVPNEILIAPGDAHMAVKLHENQVRIAFDHRKTANGCWPSVDPMLSSVAKVYGDGAMGVVLTGMGRDGALGAKELSDAGGELLVQDQESAIIWGMPGAVARQNIASLIAPPAHLAVQVARRAKAFGCG